MRRGSLAGVAAILVTAVLWGTTGTAATFAPSVGPLAMGAAALGIGGVLQALIALPQLRRASVMAGALVGSLAYLLMDFVWSSPLGWHAGVWAMLLNVAVVAAWQALGKAPHNGPALAGKRS